MAAYACAFALGLAGCAGLPKVGPSAADVVSSAAPSAKAVGDYEVIDIADASIDVLQRRRDVGLAGKFGDHRLSSEPLIGVGDTLSVTIWEAAAGGLFSSPVIADKFSAGANSATIPEQVVGRDGAITVPYAGRVKVAGRTTRSVQAVIEQSLSGKAIQPQVLVNVIKAVSDSVTVGGEAIGAAQRVQLSVKGDRLLDVIAQAGGIRFPSNEVFVELQRDGQTVRVPLLRAIGDSRENVYLQPNDVVTLVRDPQTFIAYGATGAYNSEVPFSADGINLAQALSKAGGLLDSRSDPKGVFVFRWESPSVLRELKPDSRLLARGREAPVVYRLDLTKPNSFFLEQKFRMANRDLVYVSNAPFAETEKVIGLFTATLSPATQAVSVGSAAASVVK